MSLSYVYDRPKRNRLRSASMQFHWLHNPHMQVTGVDYSRAARIPAKRFR